MVNAKPLIVCFAVMLLWGCQEKRANPVEDWRRGDGICLVHDVAIETVQEVTLDGFIKWTPAYTKARSQLFPNARYEIPPGLQSTERFGLVYVCSECTEARSRWLAAHAKTQKSEEKP